MSDPNGAGDAVGGEQIGGVAEEAAKLMGALAGWAREHGSDLGHGLGDLAGHAGAAARQVDEHVATGAPECSWCPVCRTVHAVRSLSPEVCQHLGVAASALLQAAGALLATVVAADREGRREPDVERIDLDDDWSDDDWSDDDWSEEARPESGSGNDEPGSGAPEHEGPGD